MMKKMALLLLIVLMSSTAWAVPFRSGLYVGIKAGGAYVKPKVPWAETIKDTEKDDVAFMGAVALGVRIRHFRLEAEAMMINAQKGAGAYEQETNTFTAQGYFDLPFNSPIRPFINMGLGMYTTDFKRKKEWSDKAHAFTWGGGGGLTWAISTATNLDIGYRYLDIGGFKTKDGTVRQDNHILYFGWRHVF